MQEVYLHQPATQKIVKHLIIQQTYIQLLKVKLLHTMPANCSTSMANAKVAATVPVRIVLLVDTWVRLFTSEKNDGYKPYLAIAIRIRGFNTEYLSKSKNK